MDDPAELWGKRINGVLNWQGNELYAGRLYVGGIMRVVPEGWREWPMYAQPVADDAPDYVKHNNASMRAHHERMDATPWRGWLMTSEDGDAVGHWATESEARNFTMARASELLSS